MGLAYFPFYPGDWLSSATVKKLSREARSMYLDLLCYMWQTDDCTLENNTEELCALLDTKDTNLVTNLVTRTMTSSSDGTRLENARLKAEHNKAHKAYISRVETAKVAREAIGTKREKRAVKSLDHNQNQNQKKQLLGETLLLTDDEIEKLKVKMKGDFEQFIKFWDMTLTIKDYKYRSHYLAALKWGTRAYFEDKAKNNTQPEGGSRGVCL